MTLLEQGAPESVEGRGILVLETERLVLRPPRFDDAAAIAALGNDRRIAENTLRIPYPYTLADAQAFLTAANGSGGAEIVFLITTWVGTVLGCCGMAKLDGEHPEIGYWLGVPFWGKGYATEAARAVIDHAFGDLGCEVIVGGARVSNPASRRVLQKCGFEWTGVGLYRIRALASSAPVDRFRLDRGLWASLKSWGPGQQRNVSLPRTWIETQAAGLALRLVRGADDEALFPLFADWDVIRGLSSPPWPYTRTDMQSFVRAQAATDSEDAETRFAITLEQAPIGIIGVRMRPASHLQRGDGPNIGYWIGRRYWGHGYMTAALRGVVDHVFCLQPHDAIYCGAFVGNCASLRVQEKVGFVRDGETMLYSRPRGGEFPHINTLLTRAKFVSH